MITKTQIINALEQLPENLTIDQLVDHLIFVQKVEKAWMIVQKEGFFLMRKSNKNLIDG